MVREDISKKKTFESTLEWWKETILPVTGVQSAKGSEPGVSLKY